MCCGFELVLSRLQSGTRATQCPIWRGHLFVWHEMRWRLIATLDISEQEISHSLCLNTTVSAKRSAGTTYPFNIIMFTAHTRGPQFLLNIVWISVLFRDYMTATEIDACRRIFATSSLELLRAAVWIPGGEFTLRIIQTSGCSRFPHYSWFNVIYTLSKGHTLSIHHEQPRLFNPFWLQQSSSCFWRKKSAALEW